MNDRFLILLTGQGDMDLRLCPAEAGEEIDGDNDKALDYEGGQAFTSVLDLIAHVQDNHLRVVGEFIGFIY